MKAWTEIVGGIGLAIAAEPIHEGGHALVSSILPDADPVHKISIISRGRAGGYTLKLPFEDRKMQGRKQFLFAHGRQIKFVAPDVIER